ncbi:MAG TPA: hypothetical protein VHM90_12780 [Phycisphaerae bacterium]|jgi:hypothetical protein|nr:hypothetical protein [Phycisphaerae bacterium]
MSILNPHHHSTASANEIEAYIAREKRRQVQEAEEIAIEALQIGLAFSDEGEEETPDDESEFLLENPQFEAAIQAFAQMEQQP